MPSRRYRVSKRRRRLKFRVHRKGYRRYRKRSRRIRKKDSFTRHRDVRVRVSLKDVGSVQQVPANGILTLSGAAGLNSFIDYDKYCAIFRYYKINKMTVYLRNDTSPADSGGTIGGQVNLTTGAIALTSSIRHRTTLGWCRQVAYGTSYSTRGQFESAVGYKEVNFFPSNRPWFKIGCRPRVIKELTETAASTAEVPTRANFPIPCTQYAVPHYGYQFLLQNNDPVDALNVYVTTFADVTFYGKKASSAPN